MNLGEAILLGAMMTSQAFRAVFRGDGACAWGAALLAVGANPEGSLRSVARTRWPWAFAVSVNCPSCGRSRLVCEAIAHLNDDHRWTRERIGAWVAEIEPTEAQPPEDVLRLASADCDPVSPKPGHSRASRGAFPELPPG